MPKYRFKDLLDSVAALTGKRTLADPSFGPGENAPLGDFGPGGKYGNSTLPVRPGTYDPSTLQVDVNEPGYLSQAPDLADRSIDNTYQPPYTSPISTSAQGEYLRQLERRPIPRDPGFLNKLISGVAGASEGYFGGAGRGLQTAEAYRNTPYNRALQTWEGEAAPAQAAVGYESEQNRQNLLRSKILAEIAKDQAAAGVNAYEAQTKGIESQTSRFKTQADIAGVNQKAWDLSHPEQALQVVPTGPSGVSDELIGIDKRRMKVTGTGLAGYPPRRSQSELLELQHLRNKGLQDALAHGIPENQVYNAQEDGYKLAAQQNPGRFGQFMDKTTGFLKSPAEIANLIQDPAAKLAYDDLIAIGNREAENALAKHRRGSEGYTVKPGVTIGGYQILNTPGEE